jgi:hypothetical protein
MSAELKATLRLNWRTRGSVRLDSQGKLKFPEFGYEARVYRFSIRKADGSRLEYIGETDNLWQRFTHYRNPGPTQATNLRMNALCKAILSERGEINIDVAEGAWALENGVEARADFDSKSVRRLFECFALAAGRSVEIGRLNR